MKKLLIIFSLTFFLQTNSFAVTLSKALLEAYKNNPELNAERENINVSEQNLNISLLISNGRKSSTMFIFQSMYFQSASIFATL